MEENKNRKIANSNDVIGILLKKYGIFGSLNILGKDVLYDYIKGVDTFSPVPREKLFGKDRIELSNRYVPSTFDLINSMIRLVEDEVDFGECNFIDYGSGKAKVCIGAAKFPFRVVKGIEFSKELHDIANRNIDKLKLSDRVELIHMDATVYRPTEEDRILYFFNPFMGELLDNCLKNIRDAQVVSKPKYLLYANPVNDEIFCKYFRKLGELRIEPGQVKVNYYTDQI